MGESNAQPSQLYLEEQAGAHQSLCIGEQV